MRAKPIIPQTQPRETRILFTLPFLPPYRITFFKKLCADGNEWLVLFNEKKREDGRPQYHGPKDFPCEGTELLEVHIGPFEFQYQKGAVSRTLKFNPDILIFLANPGIVSNLVLLVWARISRKKVIMWACAWEKQAESNALLTTKRWFMKHYYNLANRVLLYSSKAFCYLESLGVDKNKMEIAYNGIETDGLEASRAKVVEKGREIRQQENPNGLTVFLYVGGMLPEKRVDLLLHAFGLLRRESTANVLWLVGHGPETDRLAGSSEELGLTECVKFWGRIIEDVDPIFAASDIFVLPGIGGLALNQALFWELPSIVSEADGTEDDLVLHGKTGFRFEKNSSDSLFESMKKCTQLSAPKRRQMGAAGRQLVIQRSNVNEMVRAFARNVDYLGNAHS